MEKHSRGLGSHEHGISGHAAKHNKTKVLTNLILSRLKSNKQAKTYFGGCSANQRFIQRS